MGDVIAQIVVMVVVPLVLGMGVFGLFAPIVCYRRWTGGWKFAAGIPVAIMALVVLNILVGLMLDPSSHNLFPFEIAMAGAVNSAIMIVLILLRRREARAGAPRGPTAP